MMSKLLITTNNINFKLYNIQFPHELAHWTT